MSKIEAVPYHPMAGINPHAVVSNGRAALPDGVVPYVSWTDGAPDVEDPSVSNGNEETSEGDIAAVFESVAKRGPGRPKKES